jgi:Flp pilus assembly protein TadD
VLTRYVFICFWWSLYSACGSIETKEAVVPETYASLDSSVTYVGMNTCRQCHSGIYDSYIRTGMGRSFGLATMGKSAAAFGPDKVVKDIQKNLSYHPFWEKDKLQFCEFRLSGRDTVHKRIETVDYIVGSGQHTNSHLRSLNGYLYQLPLTYYTQEGKWDLPPGFEHGANSRFSRRIELECISCHNGYPKIVEGSENKYTSVPTGIDCERCHGPGSRHVELKSKGVLVDTAVAVDYSIVNPSKLPVDLQLDICQRCHIQGNAVTAPGKSFFDFRPGMHLSDVMDVYMPVYKGQEDEHIMASHAERMKLSACFLRSSEKSEKNGGGSSSLRPYRNAMTCVTCHNPHVSVKETGIDSYNAACNSCHTGHQGARTSVAASSKVCSVEIALRKKSRDNCVACHMPKNNTIDIPHVTTTDHFIRRPVSPIYKREVKQFITLACINNADPGRYSKGVAFLNHYEKFVHDKTFLDSAATYLRTVDESESLQYFDALVRLAFLREDYAEVNRLSAENSRSKYGASSKPVSSADRAWTCYRIAQSMEKTGRPADALSFYRSAVGLLPYQLAFRNKYAAALESSGNIEEAERQYLFLLKESPDDVTALVNYGYLLLSGRRALYEADSLYDLALSLDPDHVQALLNKTGTSVLKGDRKSAAGYLGRALKLDPANAQAQRMRQALKQ